MRAISKNTILFSYGLSSLLILPIIKEGLIHAMDKNQDSSFVLKHIFHTTGTEVLSTFKTFWKEVILIKNKSIDIGCFK